MRRLITGACAALAAVTALTVPAASAHPLGNFSINHLDLVAISRERVDVRYILDQAEIPTFQERALSAAQVLERKEAEALRRLHLTVDGRAAPLRLLPGARLSHRPGQGGLPLTRVELWLRASADTPRSVRLQDGTFPGRVGWKAIVVRPGAGTAVRSSVPASDPTRGLRAYPQDMLTSPLDQRAASFRVAPGSGSVSAPRGLGAGATTHNRSGDGLAGVFARAAAGQGVLVFLLLAAFGWGALHALSPGHGKAMVAAYLVGTRGRARHAAVLGMTVTVTHTIGVFALGIVTLVLSEYILPEQLYPWLTVASGLMVVTVGLTVLRSRLRAGRPEHAHAHTHDHAHSHAPAGIGWRSLVGMGASAGLIPCPSALVVLLGAIAQHQVALGLLTIVAFSLGLATTLTGLGIAVVYARSLFIRAGARGQLVAALPAISAVVIVAAGLLLTANGIGQVP